MANEPSEGEEIPSFENLTSGTAKRETYGRVHPTGLPPETPPGPMRVRGRNPAYKWFDDLWDTDPVLGSRLLKQVEGLPVEQFRKIIYQAYSQYCYMTER